MTPEETLEQQISFALVAADGDVFTFRREDGHSLKVRLEPQRGVNGQYALYEPWRHGPPGSRSRHLFTERGAEWVFELPLLLEANLEPYRGDLERLLEQFFLGMKNETFKNYPRDLFR